MKTFWQIEGKQFGKYHLVVPIYPYIPPPVIFCVEITISEEKSLLLYCLMITL